MAFEGLPQVDLLFGLRPLKYHVNLNGAVNSLAKPNHRVTAGQIYRDSGEERGNYYSSVSNMVYIGII